MKHLPLGFGKSNVKTRIKNILKYKRPLVWIIFIPSILAILIVASLMVNPSNNSTLDGNPENITDKIGDYFDNSTILNVENSTSQENNQNTSENTLLEPDVNLVSSISPDNRYGIETYGVNTNITAGGFYPAEGIRIYEVSTGTVLWEMAGAYDSQFLWSPDSKFVAITNMARTYSDVTVVDTLDFAATAVPIPDEIQKNMREFRPDLYFKAESWIDNKTLRITYVYTAKDESEGSGEFTFALDN